MMTSLSCFREKEFQISSVFEKQPFLGGRLFPYQSKCFENFLKAPIDWRKSRLLKTIKFFLHHNLEIKFNLPNTLLLSMDEMAIFRLFKFPDPEKTFSGCNKSPCKISLLLHTYTVHIQSMGFKLTNKK